MNRIIIGVSWSCPHCDEINNDKHYSDDGPVDELFCGGCGEWIYLKEEKAMNKHDTAMRLIMWTTFDQYFSLDSGPRILLWLLEPSDWMVTLAYYDPELIYFEYQPIDQLEVLYALT